MKHISLKFWIYIGVALLVLIFLVSQTYFSLDEPCQFWQLRNGGEREVFYNYGIGQGRPILSIIIICIVKLTGVLANLKYIRIIAVIITFFFCRMIFNYLQKSGMQQSTAFLVSVMIFTLPGSSLFICWAECSVNILSTILSFYAGALVVKVFAKHLGEKELTISHNSRYPVFTRIKDKEGAFIFFAIILQVISLFNYQGTAQAFVIPAFFILMLKPEVPSKKRIVFFTLFILFFMLPLAIYYGLFKYLLYKYNVPMTTRGEIGHIDVHGKILFFLNTLQEVSKLHFVLIKYSFIQNIFSFLIIFIIVRDLIKQRFLDLFFLLVFSVLAFLPQLIIADSWGSLRSYALVSFIFVFYFVMRVFEIIPVLSLSAAALVGSAFIAIMYFNVEEGWVKSLKKDYFVVYDFAENLPPLSTDTLLVEITPPDAWNRYEIISILRCYSDEFNIPVFLHTWDREPAIKCLYQDTHPGASVDKINKLIIVHNIQDTTRLPHYELNLHKYHLNMYYQ